MKIIKTVAATALCLGVLAAPATAAQPAYSSDEHGFVSSIRENTHVLGYTSTKNIVDLGHNTCQALRNGHSVHKLADVYLSTGVDQFDVGVVIGASVSWLCPKYTKALKRFIANQS